MTKRLLTFGDSFTAGHCDDLVERNLIEDLSTITMESRFHKSAIFKTPWPVIVAEKLNLPVINYAIPGNCNKAIIAQLYDTNIFYSFEPNDIVIVLLSTWHRDSKWNDRYSINRLFYSESGSFYTALRPVNNEKFEAQYSKRAYDAFFDYYTINTFLKQLGVEYYIGWAFGAVDEFKEYIPKQYVDEIENNNRVIASFIDYCDSCYQAGELLHPNLPDHHKYADYICSVIESKNNEHKQ